MAFQFGADRRGSVPAGTRTSKFASKSRPPDIGASRVPVVIDSMLSPLALSTVDSSRTMPGWSLPGPRWWGG